MKRFKGYQQWKKGLDSLMKKRSKYTMEKRTKKYEEELLEVIKKKKIAFFDHCFGFTSFSRRTAYEHRLHESHVIKDAINQNRVTAKNYMLNKWIASENATLQISAMRLLSDPEEHRLLNQNTSRVEIVNDTLEEAKKIADELKDEL